MSAWTSGASGLIESYSLQRKRFAVDGSNSVGDDLRVRLSPPAVVCPRPDIADGGGRFNVVIRSSCAEAARAVCHASHALHEDRGDCHGSIHVKLLNLIAERLQRRSQIAGCVD